MGDYVIDTEVEEGVERIFMSPVVTRQTVYGGEGFVEKLRAVFRFSQELVLGQSALPVLKAMHVASGEPEWLTIVVAIEQHGAVVLSLKGGWEWSPPPEDFAKC